MRTPNLLQEIIEEHGKLEDRVEKLELRILAGMPYQEIAELREQIELLRPPKQWYELEAERRKLATQAEIIEAHEKEVREANLLRCTNKAWHKLYEMQDTKFQLMMRTLFNEAEAGE